MYTCISTGSSVSPAVTTELSDDAEENLEFKIRLDMDQIQKSFATLQTDIRKSLKDKGIPTQDIVAHVIGFGVDEIDVQKLEVETSLDRVFIVLRTKLYWSFLECDLLDSIVENYGNDTDHDRMEKYKGELKSFCDRRLSEVPQGTLHLSDDQTRERIIAKLNIGDPRLSVIKDLKMKICKVLSIEPCILRIMEVKKGCIQVTFLIPIHVSEILLTESLTIAQRHSLEALSVLSLTCTLLEEISAVRTFTMFYSSYSIDHKMINECKSEITPVAMVELLINKGASVNYQDQVRLVQVTNQVFLHILYQSL